MKQIKKIGAVVSCLLVCGLLAACGAKLDARAYLQAMLDLSYKGDSAAYVEMKLGTSEEAAALYERGIDSEMTFFTEKLSMSEDLEADFTVCLRKFTGKRNTRSARQKNRRTDLMLWKLHMNA